MEVTCVVLAAGRAARMGTDKLALPFGEGTLLDAVLRACASRPTVVVAPPELAARLSRPASMTVVINDEPERGMTHSLRLADQAIPSDRALAVLLGDKPLVSEGLVARTIAAYAGGSDVVYPERDGVRGHPVILSPRARALLNELPDGDMLQRLRDDPRLSRTAIAVDDDGAFVDVDTEADYRRLTGG